MKIYDRPGFPNPARIRIVLAEKGLDKLVEFISVDLIAAEHKQQAFLAKNPAGVVPALELDDGTVITECAAITEYLDNLDGHPVLTGSTAREKGVIHMMQRRAEAFVLDPVGLYFHHATPGLGPALQAYKRPEWEGRKAMGLHEGDKVLEGYRYFDGLLARQNFLAGDRFSMADITLFAGLMFADAAGLPVPEHLGALRAWRQRVEALPCVRQRSGQQFGQDDLTRMGF